MYGAEKGQSFKTWAKVDSLPRHRNRRDEIIQKQVGMSKSVTEVDTGTCVSNLLLRLIMPKVESGGLIICIQQKLYAQILDTGVRYESQRSPVHCILTSFCSMVYW